MFVPDTVPTALTTDPTFTAESDEAAPPLVKVVVEFTSTVSDVPANDDSVIVLPATDVTVPTNRGRIRFTLVASSVVWSGATVPTAEIVSPTFNDESAIVVLPCV
jgi:hypothetical protein